MNCAVKKNNFNQLIFSKMAAFNIKSFESKWITIKITEEGIDYLSGLGLFLCDKKFEDDKFAGFNGVTSAQLRNLFSEVKRIELKMEDNPDWETDVLMLRPKIAYNTARTLQRTRGSRMKELREVLELALKSVKSQDDFRRFSKFFEGIIAYHKVYGGKE
jgi:CRISPR-associated protein Csm2